MDILDKIEVKQLIDETIELVKDGDLTVEAAVKTVGWDKSSVEKLGKTIGKSPGKPGFFDACVVRFEKRIGKDGAERFCASAKDTYLGSTYWRGKDKKKVGKVGEK